MSRSRIALAGLALVCAGCTQQPAFTPATTTHATVQVFWQRDVAAANAACRALGLQDPARACAVSDARNPSVCDIYTIPPRGFTDTTALATLGHELWHCLGARHPETGQS